MSTVSELSCSEFVEVVGAYLEGTADLAQRDSVELHEIGCAGCAEYHRQLNVTRVLLARQWRRPTRAAQPEDGPRAEPTERRAAFKFLRSGSIGPFSGFAWPHDKWIWSAEPVEACATGVHGCLARDLPYWLGEELWRVELGGPVHEAAHKLIGSCGRLVERVVEWNEERAAMLAESCAARLREVLPRLDEPSARAECEETLVWFLSLAPFDSAPAVATLGAYMARRVDGEAAEARERALQAAELVAGLGLEAD